MKIIPLGSRILVKRMKSLETTKGGIIIPDTAQEKATEGVVVALSESNYDKKGKLVSFNVSVGDRVSFATWGSELEFDHNEDTYSFINEDSIIGVLK